MTLCSGFGQTYFVSVFGGSIRNDLGLSHASYGACYSAGTLTSAFLLAWAGRLIDRTPLQTFSVATVLGLAGATALIASASGVASLALAFFATRFFGQGLMIHAAITTMGREFSAKRGRAVSVALTGHVAGSAVLPYMSVALLGIMSWRSVWLLGTLALVAGTLPGILVLLARGRRWKPVETPAEIGSSSGAVGGASIASGADKVARHDYTLADVLRDPCLYVRLSVLLAPAFITTGLIFHQVHIGAQKDWSLHLIAGALAAYSFGSFIMTIAAGPLVDRFSAQRLLPTALLPLALACIMLAAGQSETSALAFFAFMGLGTGLTQVLMGAIWAEHYGTAHLGAIRAFAASTSVLASGLAPGLIGVLLDQHASVRAIAIGCAIYCIGASLLTLAAALGPRRASSAFHK